jgi:hypothetical protein
LPSPTCTSEPTIERTWWCKNERAMARMRTSSPDIEPVERFYRRLRLALGGARAEQIKKAHRIAIVPIDDAEYRRVFAAVVENDADVIVVGQKAVNITNRKLIVDLAQENRLPAIYPLKVFVEARGLMSYGADQSEHGRSAAYLTNS